MATETEIFLERNVSEARKELPELTHRIERDPAVVVQVDRRTNPTALLVSHARFAPLVDALTRDAEDVHGQLLWLVIERWLGAAQPKLCLPQRRELENLKTAQLIELLTANPSKPEVSKLVDQGIDESILQRLRRRRKIARTLADAESRGLYDAVEHADSAVELFPAEE